MSSGVVFASTLFKYDAQIIADTMYTKLKMVLGFLTFIPITENFREVSKTPERGGIPIEKRRSYSFFASLGVTF